MKLKVCGMKYQENLEAVCALNPDYLGFIFYQKSSRYMADTLDPRVVRALSGPKKVGVFVNHSRERVADLVNQYDLDMAQLHGQESPDFCQQLRRIGIPTIKVFSVGDHFDFVDCAAYEPFCSHFLFDTKGKLPGGNGTPFNWEILAQYSGKTPFLLSGGIGPESVEKIRDFSHPFLYALDVNSRFETAPGKKDIQLLHSFQASLFE